MKIFIIWVILVTNIYGIEAEEYWGKIVEASRKKFGGFDIEVELEFNLDDQDGKGELGFRMPIYSKKDMLDRQEKKRQFLDKGADLIELYENCEGKIEILIKKMKLLKAIMTEQGVRGIEAFYNAEEELMNTRNELKKIEKKIKAMIE